MSIPGYAGNILYVDLTTGKTRKEPLDPEMVRKFIGGHGVNYRLAYDLIPPKLDPLSPKNPIIIGTGPFCGTVVPGGSEVFFTTKYPINNVVYTGAGGGHFSFMLKSSGFDHVIITGRASKPVYLKILDDDIELCDASDLWGKLDGHDTTDELRKRHEPCSVIPIGPAGENLIKYSVAFVDKGGSVGRGGAPTVMGSKNLKAMVACQGSKEIKVAQPARFMRQVGELLTRIMNWPGRRMLLELGIAGELEEWWGHEPTMRRNLTESYLPTQAQIEQNKRFWEIYKKNRRYLACATCPLTDKECISVPEGKYAGLKFYGNEVMALGEVMEDHFGQSVRHMDLMNRYGLDFITFNGVIDLTTYLYEEGIITKDDTGGIELRRDDHDLRLKLMHMTAYREGFGDILAEGIVGATERLGKGAEYAYHIKNQGLVFDPRIKGFGTMEMTQITNPRGAHVASGGSPSYLPGRQLSDFSRHANRMGATDEEVKRAVWETNWNPGRWTKFSENWFSLFNCLGLCNRAMVNRFYSAETLAGLYSAVTGIETTAEEILNIAERVYNLWRVINVRAGFSRKDDRPPEIWLTPLKHEDGKEYPPMDYFKTQIITREVFEGWLDDYYEERGWDKNGIPTPEKLKELGLDWVSLTP